MALLFVFLGALLASLANLFIRRNLDTSGTANGHLFASFGFSLISTLLLNPQIAATPFSLPMFSTGLIAGLLIVSMMGLTGVALSKGPSGLTFAFQTSGSVFPALFLFMLFGSPFGFTVTTTMLLGLILVTIGLFWASKDKTPLVIAKPWILLAIGVSVLHTILLTLIQWRCLSFSTTADHALILFRCTPEQDIWFPPGMFLAAFIFQAAYLLYTRTKPSSQDMLWGSLGGSFNGAATYCLLFATTIATPLEKGVLFPAFSVGIIMICNIWSAYLYSERINWKANTLASFGILLAST